MNTNDLLNTPHWIQRSVHNFSWQYDSDEPQYHKDVIDYACRNYGHLLGLHESMSLYIFAERIAQYYDANNPQTAEVIRVLKLQDRKG